MHAWAEHGRPLPVAVVVSIFDDLCGSLAAMPPGDDAVVSLDHVIIDHAGVARMTVQPREAVSAVSLLLRQALAAGRGDEAIPAAAWPVFGQGLAEDPWVRPAGTDVIQHQLREALGPPAARDEVLGFCSSMPAPASARAPELDVDLRSLEPRAHDVVQALDPRAADLHAAATEQLTALEVPSMVGPASEIGPAGGPGVADDVMRVVEASVLEVYAAEAAARGEARDVVEERAAEERAAVERAAEAHAAEERAVAEAHAAEERAAADARAAEEREATARAAKLAAAAARATEARAAAEHAATERAAEARATNERNAAEARAAEERAAATERAGHPTAAAALVPPAAPGAAHPPASSLSPRTAVAATLPEDDAEPPSLLPKPVVRHEPARRRPVSLPAAPVARLGASPGAIDERSSAIQLPSSDGRAQKILIALLGLASALLVAWLLGIV